jgi:hypothetical protein
LQASSADESTAAGPLWSRESEFESQSGTQSFQTLPAPSSAAGATDGSGAKAWVADDDKKMQRFVQIEDLFKGRHFDRQIIVLCVSWCTSFKLSLRDLVIMMADRGISVSHTTILRWAQRYLPEFEKRWSRYARPVGGSWRMDETYIKVHGQWPGRGQSGPDGGFLSQPEPGRKRR